MRCRRVACNRLTRPIDHQTRRCETLTSAFFTFVGFYIFKNFFLIVDEKITFFVSGLFNDGHVASRKIGSGDPKVGRHDADFFADQIVEKQLGN